MTATTLESLQWEDEAFGEGDIAQPKREKFRKSLGKVYRARAAERRGGRSKPSGSRRRDKRMAW